MGRDASTPQAKIAAASRQTCLVVREGRKVSIVRCLNDLFVENK
jgi:hypothetical protein